MIFEQSVETDPNNRPIYVTRPYLPPLEEFTPYLEKIWESHWLTNAGPFHQELEPALAEYLGVGHLSLFNNATIGLIVALQALRITGEVITTPFTFPATTHSLLWNGIKPVFVDIDPVTFNLDPSRIERAITPQTTAIMPVHCYGTPCDYSMIQKIAARHGLKVIYDAAHAFGVRVNGDSLAEQGDMSVLSFHATKVFNTFEGGAIVSRDAEMKKRIDYLKNFGIADEVTVVGAGINGKMNEVQAAFGLLQLRHLADAQAQRAEIDRYYREQLSEVGSIHLLDIPAGVESNHSYFPIRVAAGYRLTRDGLYEALRARGVYARRYFYPLMSELPLYRSLDSAAAENLPVATRVAREILCLPIYPGLEKADLDRVISAIKTNA